MQKSKRLEIRAGLFHCLPKYILHSVLAVYTTLQFCICCNNFFHKILIYLFLKPTGCKKVNTACQCSVIGAEVCSSLPYTTCADDECQCLPYTSPHNTNKECVPVCPGFLYISDGSTVSPFQIDPSFNIRFYSTPEKEPRTVDMFGLNRNGMVLRAQGTVS